MTSPPAVTSPPATCPPARYAEYLRQHGHHCPPGTIEHYQRVDLGDRIVQLGVCSCGEIIARRYTITGPGTGPWTVLHPEQGQ